MNKETKKKVAGGAAAVTAAAGAAAVGASAILSQDNDNVADGALIAEGEELKEGETLPELVVEGNAPTLNGGTLAEATITGHAPGAHVAEPQAEATVAEPQAMAQNATEHVSNAQTVAEPTPTAQHDNTPAAEPQSAIAQKPEEPEEDYSYENDPDDDNLLAQASDAISNGINAVKDGLERAFGDNDTDQPMMPDHVHNGDVSEFNNFPL